MKRKLFWRGMSAGAALFLAAAAAHAAYLDHNFDGYGVGMPFTALVDQWQASTSSVVVTNAPVVSPGRSVWLPRTSAISNAVAVGSPTRVWTETRLVPVLGAEPAPLPTNTALSIAYVALDGYLNVWTGSGWQVCSNDVWGGTVPALAADAWAEFAIFHDFGAGTIAMMLNDRVVIQDLPFLNPASGYQVFALRNDSITNVFLDDAYIQPTFAAARHAADENGDSVADAQELQNDGYVARTLYVGAGRPYASLAAALAVARDRDVIDILSDSYNETVTITQDVTLVGGSFTNAGTLTVAAGAVVTAQVAFESGLAVSGTLTFGPGVTVTTGVLAVNGSGQVVSTGGELVAPVANVHLEGSFTVDFRWGTVASMPLDFSDDFEAYADGSALASLGFRGWGASTTAVTVVAGEGDGATKGVVLANSASLSNRISTAELKVWTDYALRPQPGKDPTTEASATAASMAYVTSNGFLAVWTGGSWVTHSNDFGGTPFVAMDTNTYVRMTIHGNYTTHKAAIFLGGRLACEQVAFPAGSLPAYTGFSVASRGGAAGLDNVLVSAALPSGFSSDVDGDSVSDALEIHLYGSLAVYNGPRTIIKFR